MGQPRAKSQLSSDDLLRLMVDVVEGYAIYLLDADGTVMTWNSGAERCKGYRADEVIGRNYACFFPPEAIAQGLPDKELAEARLHGKYREEDWRVRKDGSRFWADVTLTALRDQRGQLSGFAKITRDLTAQRDHEETLRLAKEVAEGANKAKSDFIANMSHELRTPLNAIIGFSELLQTGVKGTLNENNREYAGLIHKSGCHLLKLINDLLDIAKLDANAINLHRQGVVVADAVGAAVETLRLEIEQSGLHIGIDVPDGLVLSGDPTRVKQILLNLLSNAIKFTQRDGSIFVDAREGGAELVVSVRDTGIGMSAEQIPCAMARFGQIESVLSRRHQGAGLGLPLVKQLMELHGGSLSLQSEPGIGTEVVLAFPKPNAAF